MGIVEYYERRAFNNYIDGSRLFLYKVTRNLMQVTGDAGGWLPYDYVLNNLATDFWSLLGMGWIDSGQFGV
jgi:C1A family cysteine protease